jgi:RNA polymerase sigma-70 factor, ECF subfamily
LSIVLVLCALGTHKEAVMTHSSLHTDAPLLSGLRAYHDRIRFEESWRRFATRYSPIIYKWCRLAKLQQVDADMNNFVYDPKLGFRNYLCVVTQNAVFDHRKRASRMPQSSGSEVKWAIAPEGLAQHLEKEFDLEFEAEARNRVRAEVGEKLWDIFLMLSESPQSPVEISERVGMTRNAVDNIRYRIIQRLRQQIAWMEMHGMDIPLP